MKEEMIKDVNDKVSSKRVWGGRYLMAGLIVAFGWILLHIGAVLLDKQVTVEFPYNIWISIVGTGAALIGVTVFETKINK